MDIPKKRYTGWKEIVDFVGLGGPDAIRKLARENGFPLRRVKRTVFVFHDEVEEWLRGQSYDSQLRPNMAKCGEILSNMCLTNR